MMQHAGTIVAPSPSMRLSGYLGMAESGQRGPDGLESVAEAALLSEGRKERRGREGRRGTLAAEPEGKIVASSEASRRRSKPGFFFLLLFLFLYLGNLFPCPAGLVTVAQRPNRWRGICQIRLGEIQVSICREC